MYAFKIIRDTVSNQITIYPVERIPPGIKPYRLKYPKPYYAEALQVYPTEAEALEARDHELLVSRLYELQPEELINILRESADRLSVYGITAAAACRLAGLDYNSYASYVMRGLPPNSRYVAKFSIVADKIIEVAKSASSVLPESGGCGNTRKARGGNPDVWRSQKRFRI